MDFMADKGFPFWQLVKYQYVDTEDGTIRSDITNAPGVLVKENFLTFAPTTAEAQIRAVYATSQFIHPERRLRFKRSPAAKCGSDPSTRSASQVGDPSTWRSVSIKANNSNARSAHNSPLELEVAKAMDWDVSVPYVVTTPSNEDDPSSDPQLVGFSWVDIPAGTRTAALDIDLDSLRIYTSDIPTNVTYLLSPPIGNDAGYHLDNACSEAKLSGGSATEICGDDVDGSDASGSEEGSGNQPGGQDDGTGSSDNSG